jgi:GGDEF domain-containing protein
MKTPDDLMLRVETLTGPIVCSISMGVAEYKVFESDGELIHRADVAMLVAKQRGQNCVHISR